MAKAKAFVSNARYIASKKSKLLPTGAKGTGSRFEILEVEEPFDYFRVLDLP